MNNQLSQTRVRPPAYDKVDRAWCAGGGFPLGNGPHPSPGGDKLTTAPVLPGAPLARRSLVAPNYGETRAIPHSPVATNVQRSS